MRPTSRFTYALRALVDLAIHQARGPVTVGTIAKRQGIPVRSLEQLFNRLRRKGLVQAARGPRGGYLLAQPADRIPVRRIFESVEPPRQAPPPGDGDGEGDPAHRVWAQVRQAVEATLEATTLKYLADQARCHGPGPIRHRYTFHI